MHPLITMVLFSSGAIMQQFFFWCGLFCNTGRILDFLVINMTLKGSAVAQLRYCPGICLEGLMKTMKILFGWLLPWSMLKFSTYPNTSQH